MKRVIIISFCCLFISSCATLASRPYTKKMQGVDLYSTKADMQTIYIKFGDSKDKLCASRMADVADTKSSGLTLGASAGKYGQESIGDASSVGALDLGGRSSALLIIREINYRACELSANFDLSNEEAVSLFNSVLEASKEIAISNQSVGIDAVESIAGQRNSELKEAIQVTEGQEEKDN